MNEIEYIDSIDACFPYDDEEAWRAAIDQGVGTSANAGYCALYEICGAPNEVPSSDLRRMLAYWDSQFDHPAKRIVLIAAEAALNRNKLSETQVLAILDEISQHAGLYSAVGVICQAAPEGPGPLGRTEAVEQRCNEIYRQWDKPAEG